MNRDVSVTPTTTTTKTSTTTAAAAAVAVTADTTQQLLPPNPTQWPQSPILIQCTPYTNMIIHGVRYANSTTHLSQNDLLGARYTSTNSDSSSNSGVSSSSISSSNSGSIESILPINTGYEASGQSYVIDFESSLFIGTLLFRVKGIPPLGCCTTTTTETVTTESSSSSHINYYFHSKKRQFQVVIRGRFKQPNICMSQCVTGQVFDHPAGKQLPPRIIVNGIVTLMSSLAPQLDINLYGNRPHFLSPLLSTAHTILINDADETVTNQRPDVHDSNNNANVSDVTKDVATNNVSRDGLVTFTVTKSMEDDIEEPSSHDPSSIMMTLPSSITKNDCSKHVSVRSVDQRRAIRKKVFNRLFVGTKRNNKNRENKHDLTLFFDTNKEYTFEFYQHLLILSDPDDIKLQYGQHHNMHVGLSKALNGQPIKIFAAAAPAPPPAAPSTQPQRCNGTEETKTNFGEVLWSFDLWHKSLYSQAKLNSTQVQSM